MILLIQRGFFILHNNTNEIKELPKLKHRTHTLIQQFVFKLLSEFGFFQEKAPLLKGLVKTSAAHCSVLKFYP